MPSYLSTLYDFCHYSRNAVLFVIVTKPICSNEKVMKLVQKCFAAMPIPLMITVSVGVGVDGNAFITQFGFVF